MIPKVEYYRFKTLDDALRFLRQYPDSKILAGGTDLIVQLRSGKTTARRIIDISGINGLSYIRDEDRYIKIGALITIEELKNNEIIREHAQPLWMAANNFAVWQIRNIATIGGNICNASPAADTVPPLIVLDARLRLQNVDRQREIKVKEFFKGPGETVIEKDEILTEIVIPKRDNGWRYSFIKLGKRHSHILSIVNVAVGLRTDKDMIEDVIVALGSVAPTPVRARSVEDYLKNHRITRTTLEEASQKVVKDIKPISDIRASAEYRIEMSKILVRRALNECLKNVFTTQ
ncbi:MAG: xanthine dehydrogenase family protein subunit M [Thermoproteota archaeon]|uniref:Xanthine dehydrogenase family protein subunit M n=1 Tax=Ignisphaera aggregans TaxID=334771 RepID=A0A7J3I654_9CREN